MNSRPVVISHYTMNDAYRGYECFAFGLNLDLRLCSTELTTNAQKREGLAELDACFPPPSDAAGTLVLYRGASLYANSPETTPDGLLFRQFLSSSLDISTGCHLGTVAQAHDGYGCLFKISYPKRFPFLDLSEGDDEREVLLPRGLICRRVDWVMTKDEELNFGMSMFRTFSQFWGIEVLGVDPKL